MVRNNRVVNESLGVTLMSSLVGIVVFTITFYMSFLAEPFVQETGIGQSILGYNRDFLVDGRWYFFVLIILCVLASYSSFKKLIK